MTLTIWQGWQSYRIVIEIASFFPKKSHHRIETHKKSHLLSHLKIKLNKNNLRFLRLFQFFNKLSTVLYLVASCDCFVIIMFPRKEKLEFEYDLLRHSAFCILHEIVIEVSKTFNSNRVRNIKWEHAEARFRLQTFTTIQYSAIGITLVFLY